MKSFIIKIIRAISNHSKRTNRTASIRLKEFLKVIETSQYFASQWYLEQNPDVRKAGVDPAEHYYIYGWREGRNPGPTFDNNAYFEANPDVKEAGMCPLLHYELYGKHEKRNICVAVSQAHQQNDEFIRFKKIINESSYFDPVWYLNENPDVRDAGMDPAEHYLRSGWKECRNPGPNFSTVSYLILNFDVWQADMCPLLHYELTGRKEKRKISVSSDKAASERRIEQYWTIHKNSKKVIYTCILGEKEHLCIHHCISDDYDYVCFTNNSALLRLKVYGVWSIVPLAFSSLDDKGNKEWHKLHPHNIFPEYDESIWIDSQINILTDHLFNILKNPKEDFLLPIKTPDSESNDKLKDISPSKVRLNTKQSNAVFPDTRLLYRKHHKENVTTLMNQWWDLVVKHTEDDQTCLTHVFENSTINIKVRQITSIESDEKNFRINVNYQYDHSFSLLQLQKYKKAIDEHKVISFDIFDTLLVRPYLFPKDMFLHIENIERVYGFANARVQAEIDARTDGKYDGDITIDMIYEHISDKYKHLKKKEKELEFRVCQPHPIIKELYDYALKLGKQIIAVSDMYLPKEFISELLDKNGYQNIDSVFVSSTEQARKDNGKLYDVVLSKLKCPPSNILHIGNNPISDGEKSAQHGIHSLIIEKVREHMFNTDPKLLALTKIYNNNVELSIYLGILAIHSAKFQEYLTKQQYFENLGYEYGGVTAYQFVKFISNDCIKNNTKDIAMVSRDGYTIQRVFELLNNSARLNSHYVYAPRSLCNVISCQFDHRNKDYLADFSRYYREALYDKKNESHCYSNKDNIRFVESNKDKIKCLAKRKESEYLNYLKQFQYSSPTLAVVDLVTTSYAPQRLFEKIYPGKEIIGYYWRINQTAQYDKNAKAFDSRGESLPVLEPWGLMQFLFTAPEFPLRDLKNGKPVYKNTDNENERYIVSNYPYVSDGIVNFVMDLKRTFGETDINFSPLLTAYIVKILNMCPFETDRRFIGKGGGNLSAYGVNNSNYMSLFRTW